MIPIPTQVSLENIVIYSGKVYYNTLLCSFNNELYSLCPIINT